MSTTPTPAAAPSLEQFVRDDVIDGLMDEGFTREQAESGIACGTGVTFSQLFTTSLNWLMLQRRTGRPIPATRKEAPMQTQATSVAKPNGHAPAIAARICKCGCGEIVPAENRFSYINGHRTRSAHGHSMPEVAAKRGRPRKSAPDAVAATVPDISPPVAARVSLEVTEAQLNQFLVRLSLADKQRLANHFLLTADESFAA